MKPETLTFTREELYERIWSEPMSKLSSKLGISDVALAKTCSKLEIPRPPRGHWARLAAGQDSPRPPLLPPNSKTPNEANFTIWPTPPSPDEATKMAMESEELPESRIVVPETLSKPHPLVQMSAAALRKTPSGSDGRLSCHDHQCLALRVSPKTLQRSLRILDTLLRALESRGHAVEVTKPGPIRIWKPSVIIVTVTMPLTRVKINGEWIPICLEELVDTTDLAKTTPTGGYRERYLRTPNGRLQLRVFSELADSQHGFAPKWSWTDGKKGQLETILNGVIADLYRLAWDAKRSRAEAAQNRIEQEKEAKHWRDLEAAHKLEGERRKAIGDVIRNWAMARDLRMFVADARKIAEDGHCEIIPTGQLGEWLQWCESHADSIDPLSPLRRDVALRTTERDADVAGANSDEC